MSFSTDSKFVAFRLSSLVIWGFGILGPAYGDRSKGRGLGFLGLA